MAVSGSEDEAGGLVVLSRREVYSGKVLRLEIDEIQEPGGTRGIREVVRHRGSVAALAVHDDGRIVLVRQWRHPVGASMWELPAGLLDVGESPMEGARRELEEETGLRAAHLAPVADFYTTPGFCDERMYVFRATGFIQVPARPDDDENIEVKTCSLSEALDMIRLGEIREGKTLVALLQEALVRGASR